MSESRDFKMSSRKGEAITDTEEWDNEVIEWDPSTGVYYVAGKPVSMCQGVAMFDVKEEKDEQV